MVGPAEGLLVISGETIRRIRGSVRRIEINDVPLATNREGWLEVAAFEASASKSVASPEHCVEAANGSSGSSNGVLNSPLRLSR